jgi:hypothetical protein
MPVRDRAGRNHKTARAVSFHIRCRNPLCSACRLSRSPITLAAAFLVPAAGAEQPPSGVVLAVFGILGLRRDPYPAAVGGTGLGAWVCPKLSDSPPASRCRAELATLQVLPKPSAVPPCPCLSFYSGTSD